MERDEIINLLRRIFEGEKISEEELKEVKSEISERLGFKLKISKNSKDVGKIGFHHYFFALLKKLGENTDELVIKRVDKPRIFLKLRGEARYNLKFNEVILHREEVEALYGSLPKERTKIKLLIGEKFKELPLNSDMEEYEIIDPVDFLDAIELDELRGYQKESIKYLAKVERIVRRLDRQIRRGQRLDEIGRSQLSAAVDVFEIAGKKGFERRICLIGSNVAMMPPVMARMYKLRDDDKVKIRIYKRIRPYEAIEVDSLILPVLISTLVRTLGLPRDEITEIKREEFGEELPKKAKSTKIAYTIEKITIPWYKFFI